jgi:hypothetical protein
MRPAEYITYRELFDRVPETTEVSDIFAGLNGFSTVLLASRLNIMFRQSVSSEKDGDFREFQQWFAAAFLDSETRQRLAARFASQNPERRPVCHPQQLMNVIRLALFSGEGKEDARPDISQTHRHQLGTACLMISDMLVTEAEGIEIQTGTTDERRRKLMTYMLAALEISKPTPFRNLLFRSYATYKIALQDPQLLKTINQECKGLDFEKKFEEVVGTPLMGWLSLIFGVHMALTRYGREDFIKKPETLIVNRRVLLQNPTLSQAQVDDFFDTISTEFEQLKVEIRKTRPVDERLDLVPFKAKPLLQTQPDNYACVDLSLVSEKLHNGPYFVLSNRLNERERENVFKAWGFIFETYVNWLLKSFDGKHFAALYTDTRWEDGDKSFDAVFIKKRMVVVMEFKSGFLRQDARYSNDVTNFMTDLDTKFGVGCKQLARDIAALFPEKKARGKLSGVPIPSNAEWVMPVMVVQDLMLETPFVNYFLNQHFQSVRTQFTVSSRVEVLPLNLIQITNLESLAEMADALNMDVIAALHRRCRKDPLMEIELPDYFSGLPEAKLSCRSKKFQAVFEQCFEEMSAFLFKDYPVEPAS